MINQIAIAPGDRVVPWINQCSPEWPLRPLKYAAKINSRALGENTASDFEINYIDISSVDSNGRQIPAETMTFSVAPSRARRIVASGDVIISTVRTYLKAISYIENGNDNLICSTGFAVITPSPQVHPKFLFYWVRSEWFVNEIVARSVGISYPAINAIEIGNLPFPAIPVEEQQAIADFLDHETTRIDELITRKQRLVELLQEQRTALITHAVTKGLNSDAPMKDSGVEWLGEIPAHWDIKKLKYVLGLYSGESPPASNNNEGLYPIFGANGIIGLCNSTNITQRTIVIGRVGASGEVNISPPECWVTDNVLIVKMKKLIEFNYGYYFLKSLKLNELALKNAQPLITGSFIKNIINTIPPIQEQQAIADHLDNETIRIDSLIDRINQAIEKLQEYHSALITAAVTGKIDVRQYAS